MDSSEDLRAAPAPLVAWENEGGAIAVRRSGFDGDPSVLERLGAAMVREWHRLPMPVQRRLYEAAASSEAGASRPAARRELARFLHEHKRGHMRG